jgi:hypothetical protein
MAQHDAAGADTNVAGLGRDARNQDLGDSTGEPLRAVMLGQPIPGIAEAVGGACQLERLGHCLRRGPALADGRLVEDAQLHPGPTAQAA